MKTKFSRLVFGVVLSTILFTLAVPTVSIAENETEGSSVTGRFKIALEKGRTRSIEFHVVRSLGGSITGEAVFQDESPTTGVPADGAGSDETAKTFFLKAEFDCLVIEGNKAVMSGAITEASLEHYIGRRVLLVAQENGGPEGSPTRDKLTWGVYRNTAKNWLPADSERPDEASGQVTWIAFDSERPDDPGVLSAKQEVVTCQSIPLSAFAFVDARQARGSVRVRP